MVLKDIHNVARRHHKQNDYQELVAEMKKVKGNLAGRKLSAIQYGHNLFATNSGSFY